MTNSCTFFLEFQFEILIFLELEPNPLWEKIIFKDKSFVLEEK